MVIYLMFWQHIITLTILADNSIIISSKNRQKFLENMGIEEEIVSTPSHSEDSISLVLNNRTCFVGDLEPIEYLEAYIHNVKLKKDWQLVGAPVQQYISPSA